MNKYLLFVGTIQPRKNLPALIEAYARVKADFPDLKLVIVGGKGWMTKETFGAVARWGVQDGVVFTGRVSDKELANWYQGALIYIQPSIQEGFGLPVLEAMKRGVPVIVSNGGALREVVGAAGVIVPINNIVNGLVAAITKLLRDPSRREQLAKLGRRRVATLTWQKSAEETWKVMKELGYYKI